VITAGVLGIPLGISLFAGGGGGAVGGKLIADNFIN
jgi:hypothetical protein